MSHDGLQQIEDTKLQMVFLRPGVDFSVYDKITLLECGVAFRKDWQRDHNRGTAARVSKSDMDEIRAELAGLFDEVMREELGAEGGLQLVATPDERTLILRPAIIDLDIAAPDLGNKTAGVRRTMTTSAGAMTLYMEFYDGETGAILGRIADREQSAETGRMMWRSSAGNRAEARRILQRWAVTLRDGMQEVRTRTALPASATAQ